MARSSSVSWGSKMPDVDEPMAYCIGCGDMLDAIDIVAGERVCPRCASRDLMESMLPSEQGAARPPRFSDGGKT